MLQRSTCCAHGGSFHFKGESVSEGATGRGMGSITATYPIPTPTLPLKVRELAIIGLRMIL